MSEHEDRTGLYIMVLFILLGTCDNGDRLDRIERDLDKLGQDALCAEPLPEDPND